MVVFLLQINDCLKFFKMVVVIIDVISYSDQKAGPIKIVTLSQDISQLFWLSDDFT